MRDRIKSYVRETMKSYDVNDGKLAKELVSACYDEYEMQLSNGAGEEEAYAAAVANIEEIVKSKVSPRNKYTFALGMGVLALFLSAMEMIASLLVRNIEFHAAVTAGMTSSFWACCSCRGLQFYISSSPCSYSTIRPAATTSWILSSPVYSITAFTADGWKTAFTLQRTTFIPIFW